MTTELHNATLEWAAQWAEGSLKGEPNERVREFGRNMAMTLRAAKVPDLTPVAQPPNWNIEASAEMLSNWPVRDVLARLADAATHLLTDHDCDAHGYEALQHAIVAARAHAANSWQYVHERDAELIRKDGLMCEAHPGAEFEHDPNCAGPGMAWAIEGKTDIALAITAAVDKQRASDAQIVNDARFEGGADLRELVARIRNAK